VHLHFALVSHPCLERNGGCSHICRISYDVSLSSIKNPLKAICGCPLHYHPDQDGKNCSGTFQIIHQLCFFTESQTFQPCQIVIKRAHQRTFGDIFYVYF